MKKLDKIKLHKIDDSEKKERKQILTVLKKEELKDKKFRLDEMRRSSDRDFYQHK